MDFAKEKAYIFGSIFTLSNRLQVLGDKFDRNLTIKQWLLLVAIFQSERDAPTISEVASLIGNSRQNVKKMALILERDGFLTIQKDLQDARILRIRLTKKCEDYFKQREERELEFLEKLYDGFDSELIQGFANGILKLEENITKMEKQYDQKEKE
jgi:DNA-binding MarR family transcriptional regulator